MLYALRRVVMLGAAMWLGTLTGTLALVSPAPSQAEPLTLVQAIAAARTQAPSVDVARAQLLQAESLIDQAWSLLLPTLQSSLTYTHWDFEVAFDVPRPDGTGADKAVIQNQDQLDARNSISISLFNYSALPLLDNAYDNVDRTALGVKAASRAVAYQAASAYVQVLATQRAVTLAEADVAFFEEHLRAENARLDGGIGDKLAVIRTEQELLNARHRLADATRSVTFAKESLALVMNRRDTDFEVADDTQLPPAPEAAESGVDALVDQAYAEREDVAMSEAAIALAERDVDARWGDFLPKLNASFNHTWSNAPGFASTQNRWNIMLTGTWTWFDGGLRYGQLDEKRGVVAERTAQLEATKDRVRQELLQAQQRLRDAARRVEQAQSSIEFASQATASAKKLLDAGLVDYLKLFDARHAERQSELAILQAQVHVELAQLGLLQAVGIDLGR